jgi:putative acetyltransferase
VSEALRIRAEEARDRDAVRRVLVEAFGRADEARLVDGLRAAGDIALALVAERGEVIGYVAFSRLSLEGEKARALGLAPLAVLPNHQRQGVGSALMREGTAVARAGGHHALVVLGDPAFFRHFGFDTAPSRLRTPYGGPYLQVLALRPEGAALSGAARYPVAFAGLA